MALQRNILSVTKKNKLYCYKRTTFGLFTLYNFRIKSSRCSTHSVKCVVLIIKYLSWNDFTPLNDFFFSGSALLLLALFVNSQFIPSTSAAPIDCQKNTAFCLEEIMEELTQLQFEVKILTENRTLVRCTCTFF